jgi:TatA/E family protein of Tat protein translocase
MMGLGMGEVVLILVIALVVFGPRKLPELGKSLGQAMSQFRRASEDFKRTWEQEVEIEKVRTSESAGSSYNSSGSGDYYNPYADDSYSNESQPAQLKEGGVENAVSPNAAQPETVAATAQAGEKKHWI